MHYSSQYFCWFTMVPTLVFFFSVIIMTGKLTGIASKESKKVMYHKHQLYLKSEAYIMLIII